MRDNENITILLLVLTASVLTAMLVMTFVQTAPEPAQAGQMVRGGEYLFGTASINPNVDIVYVVDGTVRGINAYYVNQKTKSIDKITGVEFSKIETFNRIYRQN